MSAPRPITYGRPIRHLNANGFVLTETSYSPGLSIPAHAHDNAVWVYVVEGSVSTETSGQRSELSAAGLRWVPAGNYHSNRYGSAPCRCLLIEFGENQAAHIASCSDVLRRDASYQPGAFPALVARRVYAEFRNGDPVAPLAIEGLLFEAVARTARTEGRRGVPPWLERIRAAIEAEYRRGVSIGELSAAEGIHPVHAARMFRRHFGCSPSQFVRARRVQFAADELHRSDAPLSHIAARSGFSDQSHLTREFRRVFGTTPAAFRRAHSLD